MPTKTNTPDLSPSEAFAVAAVPDYVSRITPADMAQMSKAGPIVQPPTPPLARPLDYEIAGETVYFPTDERRRGGISDGAFLHTYRPEPTPTVSAFTRLGLRDALRPDSDGRPTGGMGIRAALRSFTPDEVPAHIADFARFSYYAQPYPDDADIFAPMTDDDLRTFLGDELYKYRDQFPKTTFVTEREVETMREAYAAFVADRDAEQPAPKANGNAAEPVDEDANTTYSLFTP